MGINHWPEAERPREKLLLRGAESLSDAELLAIFLRTGVAGKSAIDLARELLHDFNGLRELLEADQKSFCQAKGLGSAKYAQLQATLELCRRYLQASLTRGDALTSTQATRAFLSTQLRQHRSEVFACLFLDNQHRVIEFKELFYGTIDGASVYAREVVRQAIHHNAAAVIFAHNHPSGVTEPSRADQAITRQLKSALDLIDVRVLDHFVIGDGEGVSMAERGMI